MAVPFRRISKTAKRKRRTHQKLTKPNLIVCPDTHNFTLSHRLTANSSYYKGKLILIKNKKKQKEVE
ncbi:50S ribosomal protein L32 [Candidatus Phytoplasma ziziphi]|uniref:Large ribosomal subunit protein bL32 n=1 Tax=Ziziphus jujuba witches'-broom phytoplasma TaxID=135727 RepID=A0A660HM75_ZIZJU|nr:50S ribosomal protein L32 [Candidatus Phytoplasma ziziphi]AYJ01130.1 50S ribosomal protein L32 [Candidatus Phytoplasma ziziphi]